MRRRDKQIAALQRRVYLIDRERRDVVARYPSLRGVVDASCKELRIAIDGTGEADPTMP